MEVTLVTGVHAQSFVTSVGRPPNYQSLAMQAIKSRYRLALIGPRSGEHGDREAPCLNASSVRAYARLSRCQLNAILCDADWYNVQWTKISRLSFGKSTQHHAPGDVGFEYVCSADIPAGPRLIQFTTLATPSSVLFQLLLKGRCRCLSIAFGGPGGSPESLPRLSLRPKLASPIKYSSAGGD